MPEFSPWSDHAFSPPVRNGAPGAPLRISDAPEFHSLRRAQRRSGARASAVSAGGFLVYVLLSSFAAGPMNQPLFGHLTVGLALGLAQFPVMAVTAWCHLRHMRTRVDPLARGLRSRLRRSDTRPRGAAGRDGGHGTGGLRTW
ncbi:DUF485 domain-containing protein [Streptomyces sp. NPDC085946]|uniref:DUF485 domain-containing protein n=1 Tax=Streptomyces sp. NPDC085946 TaxID=3365744 RepID=UPI0037CD0B9A